MTDLNIQLKAGDIISYSAGSESLVLEKFRIINEKEDRTANVFAHFPHIMQHFMSGIPIMLGCYPATLGFFPSVIFLETYLRQINFSRGLLLAKKMNSAVIIIGQPLAVFDRLINHILNGHKLPNTILFVLGGYYCPISLEHSFSDICSKNGVQHSFLLHAYGVAEATFGCFIGERNIKSGKIMYRSVISNVKPINKNKDLYISIEQENGEIMLIPTGDQFISESSERFIIENGNDRLLKGTLKKLNAMNIVDWSRRTGYITHSGKEYIFQLRRDITPKTNQEMEYWEFCHKFDMDWMMKPNWG